MPLIKVAGGLDEKEVENEVLSLVMVGGHRDLNDVLSLSSVSQRPKCFFP